LGGACARLEDALVHGDRGGANAGQDGPPQEGHLCVVRIDDSSLVGDVNWLYDDFRDKGFLNYDGIVNFGRKIRVNFDRCAWVQQSDFRTEHCTHFRFIELLGLSS
jgi:hypothetical protein